MDEEEDSIADAIAMLGRQFNKVLKRVDRRNRQNGQSIRFDINKQHNSLKKTKPEEKSSQGKGVQCHECEGYGHIRSECGTYQKRQKKGLTVSWTDEDTNEEKVIQVNAQMDDLRKRVSQLNSGANLLEEILDNVPSGKLKSVGYNYSSLNQYQQNPETKFTSSEEVFDPCTGKVMLEHQTRHSKAYPVPKFALDLKSSVHQRPRPVVHQRPKNQRRYRRWVCHHCGKRGHIRPFCYKLYGLPNLENILKSISIVSILCPHAGASGMTSGLWIFDL
ncbi:gag-protease polyprotein [Trifolium repens]|nr:gag-protease polyprotein [Trifolium repens]